MFHVLVGLLPQGRCLAEEFDQPAEGSDERSTDRTPRPRSQQSICPVSDEEEGTNGDRKLQA